MKKLKIAFIEDDTADGGLGMVFRSLANFFSEQNDVNYISIRPNEGRISEDIQYIRLNEKREFTPHTNGISRSVSGVGILHNELKKLNPDVAISFCLYSNIRLCLACKGLKWKVLISERGNATRFKGIYRLIITALLSRTDCIVFQSSAAKRAYPALLGKKGVVINNALFKDNLPDSTKAKWNPRIVSVGRIHPDKNFTLLLDAFSTVISKFPNYRLEIYGEEEPGSPEPYLKQLKDHATKLGIYDKVDFMGQSTDVGHSISGARLFVLSSVLEGMPNALIEAMACGLPCITTDFLPGCANEIITDGVDGCIVANCDVKALSEKICEVLSDDEWSRHMAEKAIDIRERFSKNHIFHEWKETVEQLCSN